MRSHYSSVSLCASGKRLLFTTDVYFAPTNTAEENDKNVLFVLKKQKFEFPLPYAPADLQSIHNFGIAQKQYVAETETETVSAGGADWAHFQVHSKPVKVECQSASSANSSLDFFEYILPELPLLANSADYFPVFVRKLQKYHESTFKTDVFGEAFDLGSILSRHDGADLLKSEEGAEVLWITHELNLAASYDHSQCSSSSGGGGSGMELTDGVYRWVDGLVSRDPESGIGKFCDTGNTDADTGIVTAQTRADASHAPALEIEREDMALGAEGEGCCRGRGSGSASSCLSTPGVDIVFVYTGLSHESGAELGRDEVPAVECWITFDDADAPAATVSGRHIAVFSLLDGDFVRVQIHCDDAGSPPPVDLSLHLSLFLILHDEEDGGGGGDDTGSGPREFPEYSECRDLHGELIPDMPWLRLINAAAVPGDEATKYTHVKDIVLRILAMKQHCARQLRAAGGAPVGRSRTPAQVAFKTPPRQWRLAPTLEVTSQVGLGPHVGDRGLVGADGCLFSYQDETRLPLSVDAILTSMRHYSGYLRGRAAAIAPDVCSPPGTTDADTGVLVPSGMKEHYLALPAPFRGSGDDDVPSPRRLIQLVNSENDTVLTQTSPTAVRGKFPGRVMINFDASSSYLRGLLPGGEEVFVTVAECLAATPVDHSTSRARYPPMGFASTSASVPSTVSAVAAQAMAMELQSHVHSITRADPNADPGISAYFMQCAKKLVAFHRYALLPPAGRQQYWNDLKKCQQLHALHRHQHKRECELAAIRQRTAVQRRQLKEMEAEAARVRRREDSVQAVDTERGRQKALVSEYIARESDLAWREAQWERAKRGGAALGGSDSGGRVAVTPSGSSLGSTENSVTGVGADASLAGSVSSPGVDVRLSMGASPQERRGVSIVTPPGTASYDAANRVHNSSSVSPYYDYHHVHLAAKPTLVGSVARELREHPTKVPIAVVSPEAGHMQSTGADFTPLSSTYGRRYSQEIYMRDKIAGAKLFARDSMTNTKDLLEKLRSSY